MSADDHTRDAQVLGIHSRVFHLRDSAGTSIPVSWKMKQDCLQSTPRSRWMEADLWPATSVGTQHITLPVLQRMPFASLCLGQTVMCS